MNEGRGEPEETLVLLQSVPDQEPPDVAEVPPALRRGVLMFAVVVGVLALAALVASLLGGSSSPDSEGTAGEAGPGSEATSTVPLESTTSVSGVATTTVPAPTTAPTTVAGGAFAAPTTGVVTAGDGVFEQYPTRSRLVLWSVDDTSIALFEPDTGEIVLTDLAPFGVNFVNLLAAVGDRLVIGTSDELFAFDPVGGEIAGIAGGGGVVAIGDDEVWATTAYKGDSDFVPVRIGIDGSTRQAPLVPGGGRPLAAWGDLLMVGGGDSGGIYLEEGNGYRRVAQGALLAASPPWILHRVCDDSFNCGLFRTNLETGQVDEFPAADVDVRGIWWIRDVVAPTADAVLGISGTSNLSVVVELRTGQETPVPVSVGRGVAWSPDGQWLFLGGDGQVMAFHRPTGTTTTLVLPPDIEFRQSIQIAVLPLEPTS